jgi:hypothetical protein
MYERANIFLSFGTSGGNTRTLRVNNPDLDLTDSIVRSSMDSLINSQSLYSERNGFAEYPRAAFLETVLVTPVPLPL